MSISSSESHLAWKLQSKCAEYLILALKGHKNRLLIWSPLTMSCFWVSITPTNVSQLTNTVGQRYSRSDKSSGFTHCNKRTEWYSKWNLDARYRHYSVQNDIFKCPSIYINSRQRIYVEVCQDWQWESNDGSLDYFYLTWTLTADRSTVRFDVASRTWMSMKLTYLALLEMNILLWQDLV